jgi:alkylated DNA repair dioxygenase AlkB
MRWTMPAGGELELIERFIEPEACAELLAALCAALPLEQRPIRIMGRTIMQPRLVAWIGDEGTAYTYSSVLNEPAPWPQRLLELRALVSHAAGAPFNSVLCNLYRDGNDSMGFHADAEPELGPEPVIASLSLGATRRFQLRHKKQVADRLDLELVSGSLLVMRGALQQHYRHAVPKQRAITAPRLNLTFRVIRAAGARLERFS